jgi:hypothetical protein
MPRPREASGTREFTDIPDEAFALLDGLTW